MKTIFNMLQRVLSYPYQWLGHFLYDLEIRKKLYAINIVITIVPVIILGTKLYLISNQNLVETENSFLSQSAQQLRDIMDFYLEGAINKSDILFSDQSMQELLSVKYDDYGELLEMYVNFRQKVLPLLNEYKYPNLKYSSYSLKNGVGLFLTFYSKNDTINKTFQDNNDENIRILDFKQLEREPWYQKIRGKVYTFYWRPVYSEKKYVQNTNTPIKVISLNRQFINFKTMEDLGIISLAIPMDSIVDMLKRIKPREDCTAYLLDEEGGLICSSQDPGGNLDSFLQAVGKKVGEGNRGVLNLKLDQTDTRVYYETSVLSGWKVVLAESNRTVEDKNNQILVTTLTISLLSFIGSLVIMLTLSRAITRRLNQLTTKIHKIKKDTALPLQEIKGSDEIGEMDQQFNSMIRRINHLIETDYKVKLYSQKIEYELLQEQINPHLLYNSLTAIRWMTKKYGNTEAGEITENLIGFYKASLSRGNVFIKISDEIAIISEYIHLNRRIYNLDLDYELDIEETLHPYYCMKLILQPAVENALIHGLKNSERKGCIRIRGRREGALLIFDIADNGDGMSPETIEKIMDDTLKEKKGFGLYNVKKRIKLYYGEEYGLSITSEPGSGTQVHIKIPCCDREGNILPNPMED